MMSQRAHKPSDTAGAGNRRVTGEAMELRLIRRTIVADATAEYFVEQDIINQRIASL
jgi:hypothetical protein